MVLKTSLLVGIGDMELFFKYFFCASLALCLLSCKARTFGGKGEATAVNPDTELSAVPWVQKSTVALIGYDKASARHEGDVNAYRAFCTGTLVSRQAVITAGHCVSFSFFSRKPSKIFVLFDSKLEQDPAKRQEQNQTKMFEVSMKDGIRIHSKAITPSSFGSLTTSVMTRKKVSDKEKMLGRRLNAQEAIELHRELKIFDYDVAVVRISEPAPETYSPMPISSDNELLGDDGISAGYGLAYWYLPGMKIQMQWEEIAASGHQVLGELRSTSGKRVELLEGKTLFVTHRNEPTGMSTMAPGDSGGPYFQKNSSGEWRLVGVLSGPCDLWNNHEEQKIPPLPCTRYQYLPASEEFIRTNIGNQ